MSIHYMNLVYQSALDKSLKAIALAYADHADDEGRHIYPAVERIAWKTGYSERQVQRITKQLVVDGVLRKDGRGPSGTNRYKMAHLPERPPFKTRHLIGQEPEISSHPSNPDVGGDKMSGVTSTTLKMEPMSPDPSFNQYINKGNPFGETTIPPDVDELEIDKAELNEMISEVAGTCKGHHNPFDDNDEIRVDAIILIMNKIPIEEVRAFRNWWKAMGYYDGKPSPKTLMQEIENSMAGVIFQKNGKTDWAGVKAWREVLEWVERKRTVKEFSSEHTVEVIRTMGESAVRGMTTKNKPHLEAKFKELFSLATA